MEPCPRCLRRGWWEDFFCPVCYGNGRVRSQRAFSLTIPPEVRQGTQVRLSLEDIGLKDVFLTVLVTIDPLLNEW
jgi:DnaJ-class molecular chaperone